MLRSLFAISRWQLFVEGAFHAHKELFLFTKIHSTSLCRVMVVNTFVLLAMPNSMSEIIGTVSYDTLFVRCNIRYGFMKNDCKRPSPLSVLSDKDGWPYRLANTMFPCACVNLMQRCRRSLLEANQRNSQRSQRECDTRMVHKTQRAAYCRPLFRNENTIR